VKLLDLGVARIMETEGEDEKASITQEQNESVLGTADYLSPEQAIDSHNVDNRSDIYSLGCTLYFLLTAHPPFPHGSLAHRMLMHQLQKPASILEDREDAPQSLIDICDKMIEKSPKDRYQSAGEVSRVLQNWLNGEEDPPEENNSQPPTYGSGKKLASETMVSTDQKAPIEARPSVNQQVAATATVPDVQINCQGCGQSYSYNMYRDECPHCAPHGTENDAAAVGFYTVKHQSQNSIEHLIQIVGTPYRQGGQVHHFE
jgi:serine/threonine protein kinase